MQNRSLGPTIFGTSKNQKVLQAIVSTQGFTVHPKGSLALQIKDLFKNMSKQKFWRQQIQVHLMLPRNKRNTLRKLILRFTR